MENIGQFSLTLIVLVVMLVGLFGLLTTVVPGLVIIWLAAVVYYIATGFSTGSIILMVVMTLLMLGGNLLDNLFMGASARKTGASWLAVGVALVGALVGSLAFPPFGGLIVALVGIFLVEFYRLRDWRKAAESAKSLAAGCGWAVLARFAVGMVMIGMWLGWVLLA